MDRLTLLGALDGLLPAQRSGVGRFLIDALVEARGFEGEEIFTRARSIVPMDGAPWLGFLVASEYSEMVRVGIENWVLLRHAQRRDVQDWSEALTVGVLLTPRQDGRREWDTTVIGVKGAIELDGEVEAAALALWGSAYDAPTS